MEIVKIDYFCPVYIFMLYFDNPYICSSFYLNLFTSNAPFLYPLKISEYPKVF